MLYGEFIRELNRDCGGAIVAYESKLQRQGCVVFLGKDRTIFIPFQAMVSLRREVIVLIQTKILEGVTDKAHLIVVMRNGKLILENEQ